MEVYFNLVTVGKYMAYGSSPIWNVTYSWDTMVQIYIIQLIGMTIIYVLLY